MTIFVKKLLRPIYAPLLRQYQQRKQLLAQQSLIYERVNAAYKAEHLLKIIIGAGATTYDGWIATDIPAFDVLKHEHWANLFQPHSVHRMLAEHVFEHLTQAQFREFLWIARNYLAKEGRIRIAVPDGNHPDPKYIESVRPGGTGQGADEHQVLYTFDLMRDLLEAEGYHYQFLEYFDMDGQFHQVKWDTADGIIQRSVENDSRNTPETPHAYTSLIVDFWMEDLVP